MCRDNIIRTHTLTLPVLMCRDNIIHTHHCHHLCFLLSPEKTTYVFFFPWIVYGPFKSKNALNGLHHYGESSECSLELEHVHVVSVSTVFNDTKGHLRKPAQEQRADPWPRHHTHTQSWPRHHMVLEWWSHHRFWARGRHPTGCDRQ